MMYLKFWLKFTGLDDDTEPTEDNQVACITRM